MKCYPIILFSRVLFQGTFLDVHMESIGMHTYLVSSHFQCCDIP